MGWKKNSKHEKNKYWIFKVLPGKRPAGLPDFWQDIVAWVFNQSTWRWRLLINKGTTAGHHVFDFITLVFYRFLDGFSRRLFPFYATRFFINNIGIKSFTCFCIVTLVLIQYFGAKLSCCFVPLYLWYQTWLTDFQVIH